MKQYDSYKDSGVEWIGKIPSHWNISAIKHFCHQIFAGGTPNTSQNDYWNGDIDWLPSGVCHDNRVFDSTKKITQKGVDNSSTKFIPKGTALIAMTGATCGHTAYCEIDAFANQSVTAYINDKKRLNSIYLWYLLQSGYYYIDTFKTGGAQGGINVEQCKNFAFCIPPLSEQQAIADFLDTQTARIDSIIASREKKIKLLEELRASIISQAVTKGIRKDVQLKDSGIEWIGQIPKHWEFAPLKRYAKIETGSTPSTNVSKYWENPNIDWYTPGDFYGGLKLSSSSRKVEEIALKEEACPTFNPETVLVVGIGASLGNVGIANKICSSNQQINAIFFGNKIVPLFGAYYLSSIKEVMKSVSNSATLAIMNQSTTKGLVITCPPLKEQKEIVAFIEDKMSRLNSGVSKAQREISLLREYRTSLITEVVTGKRKLTK